MPLISPYSPRRRRSARLVIIWLATFLLVLWLTWYVSTRHAERAKPYLDELLLGPGAAAARRKAAAAGAGAAGEAGAGAGAGAGSGGPGPAVEGGVVVGA